MILGEESLGQRHRGSLPLAREGRGGAGPLRKARAGNGGPQPRGAGVQLWHERGSAPRASLEQRGVEFPCVGDGVVDYERLGAYLGRGPPAAEPERRAWFDGVSRTFDEFGSLGFDAAGTLRAWRAAGAVAR